MSTKAELFDLLLVDDNIDYGKPMVSRLNRIQLGSSYTIKCMYINSPTKALAHFQSLNRREVPIVCLIDIRLNNENINGIDLVFELKKKYKNLLCIAISADDYSTYVNSYDFSRKLKILDAFVGKNLLGGKQLQKFLILAIKQAYLNKVRRLNVQSERRLEIFLKEICFYDYKNEKSGLIVNPSVDWGNESGLVDLINEYEKLFECKQSNLLNSLSELLEKHDGKKVFRIVLGIVEGLLEEGHYENARIAAATTLEWSEKKNYGLLSAALIYFRSIAAFHTKRYHESIDFILLAMLRSETEGWDTLKIAAENFAYKYVLK